MKAVQLAPLGKFYSEGDDQTQFLRDAMENAKIAVVTRHGGIPKVTFVTSDNGTSLSGPTVSQYKDGVYIGSDTSHGIAFIEAGIADLTLDIDGAVAELVAYVESVS